LLDSAVPLEPSPGFIFDKKFTEYISVSNSECLTYEDKLRLKPEAETEIQGFKNIIISLLLKSKF
jgi:hypothetical protein